ncbi:MAG: hypothetical protein H7328_09610 [Bdellovibrio sp.]|nr:hypothetical protein [Bdellovibrio sp.]
MCFPAAAAATVLMVVNNFKMSSHNQKGSVMVWVLVASVSIAGVASFLPQLFTANERAIKINYARSSILIVKESIIAMLDNDAVWAETLNHNLPTMSCLTTAGAICAAGPHAGIELYDAEGNLFLSQAANSGLTLTGEPCNTFDAANGHPTCVLKFNLTWECNGACPATQFNGVLIADKPSIKLKANLIFAPEKLKEANLVDTKKSDYSFDILRGSQTKTLSNFCNSITGVFNQQSQSCAAATSEQNTFDCTVMAGPKTFFVGFSSNGTPKCMNYLNLGAMCPSGTAVIGYREDGVIACGAF